MISSSNQLTFEFQLRRRGACRRGERRSMRRHAHQRARRGHDDVKGSESKHEWWEGFARSVTVVGEGRRTERCECMAQAGVFCWAPRGPNGEKKERNAVRNTQRTLVALKRDFSALRAEIFSFIWTSIPCAPSSFSVKASWMECDWSSCARRSLCSAACARCAAWFVSTSASNSRSSLLRVPGVSVSRTPTRRCSQLSAPPVSSASSSNAASSASSSP